jgi:Myosin-like coiled-coil protein
LTECMWCLYISQNLIDLSHSTRERLKEVLRQYELRERHFECVIRSKELEVLLSRARAAEQKQLAERERNHADKTEEDVGSYRL